MRYYRSGPQHDSQVLVLFLQVADRDDCGFRAGCLGRFDCCQKPRLQLWLRLSISSSTSVLPSGLLLSRGSALLAQAEQGAGQGPPSSKAARGDQGRTFSSPAHNGMAGRGRPAFAGWPVFASIRNVTIGLPQIKVCSFSRSSVADWPSVFLIKAEPSDKFLRSARLFQRQAPSVAAFLAKLCSWRVPGWKTGLSRKSNAPTAHRPRTPMGHIRRGRWIMMTGSAEIGRRAGFFKELHCRPCRGISRPRGRGTITGENPHPNHAPRFFRTLA